MRDASGFNSPFSWPEVGGHGMDPRDMNACFKSADNDSDIMQLESPMWYSQQRCGSMMQTLI